MLRVAAVLLALAAMTGPNKAQDDQGGKLMAVCHGSVLVGFAVEVPSAGRWIFRVNGTDFCGPDEAPRKNT